MIISFFDNLSYFAMENKDITIIASYVPDFDILKYKKNRIIIPNSLATE